MKLNRRDILGSSAALAASVAWRPFGSGWFCAGERADADAVLAASAPSTSIACGGEPNTSSNASPRPDEIEAVVRWVMTTPRDPALARGARELHAGLDPSHLFGAILVASARDIRTDVPKFNHAALSVSAIDQLTSSASVAERAHATLWCLDHFKEDQESEARSDDWRMPPVERARLPDGARARAALVDALEHWDREAADVALVGWMRSAPLDDVYALVWEYGTRCVANLGHKAIYACLSRRALPFAGERFAEDVLRSVVSSFFLDGRSHKAAAFETSRDLVAREIDARAQRSVTDVGPARELLEEIRVRSPEELPAIVADLVGQGAAAPVLWDAVVVAASEIAVADPRTGPLHALTSANSLHTIARLAPSARVGELALMQAAAWMGEFRSTLRDKAEKSAVAFRIDAVEPREMAFETMLTNEARGPRTASGAVWLAAHDFDGFVARAQVVARMKSDDVHEFKLAAAALEEARLAGKSARPLLCAALATHLAAPDRADSARLERIRDAVAVASASGAK